jgi:hypothetical protein
MSLCAHVKGFLDNSRDASVEGIKRRLAEGLDGRRITWLAERLGENYKNLQRWITGDVAPPLDFIPRYCEATGVSIEWVMTGNGPRTQLPPGEAEVRLGQIEQILKMPRDAFRPMSRIEGDADANEG